MAVFKGTKNIWNYEISDQVGANVVEWLKYGLLEAGGFTTAQFSDSNTSGYCNLKRVHDDRYTDGSVYEGLGTSFIWETDVTTIDSSTPPIRASGVVINNTFQPSSGVGIYAHTIDYKNGRIVFSTPLAPSVIVKCQYSFPDISVYLSDNQQWKVLITNYLIGFDNLTTSAPSGISSILKENRIWLPSVVVETKDVTNTGLQLGGGELATVNVLYHIFADKPFINKRLCDFINNQKELTLELYDVNTAPQSLRFNGSLNPSGLTYKQLAQSNGTYFWTTSYIEESRGGARDSLVDVYRGEINQRITVYRYLHTY